MGYDPFSPVGLAQINVLCLPVSQISKRAFSQCVDALRRCVLAPFRCNSTGNASDETNSSGGGWVLLNISDSHSSGIYPQLYPFDNNREPQIVVGIALGEALSEDGSHRSSSDISSLATNFKTRMSSYKHAVTTIVIQFGGSPPKAAGDHLYVDDTQNSAAVLSVASEIISCFQKSLPQLLPQLQDSAANGSDSRGAKRRSSVASTISNRQRDASIADPRVDESSQKVSEYRENIAFGIFCLQAGQWSDALRLLSESTISARSSGDHLWYARGLEALTTCMVLHVWAHMDFKIPQVCFPNNEKHSQVSYSTSMDAVISSNRAHSVSLFGNTSTQSSETLTELLPHIIGLILGLYERAVNNLKSIVPLSVLCEARVRWSSFLVVLRAYGSSLTIEFLRNVVENEVEPLAGSMPTSSSPVLVLRKTALSQLLVDASQEAQAKLTIEQSASLQLALARSFSILGIERKQAFHLKQFLQRLIPALVEARRRGAAELGIHPSATFSQLECSTSLGAVRLDQGIGSILRSVAAAYGLPTPEPDRGKVTMTPVQQLNANLEFWYTTHNSGDLFIKLEILGICIEISDALPDPRNSLFFTSFLLQSSRRSITVSPQHDDKPPLISPQDLPRILQNLQRAVASAQSLGIHDCRADYWDKFLVRDVTLVQHAGSNRLMPHTAHDLSVAAGPDAKVQEDPFIFNPFAKPKIGKGELIVTLGDILYFDVVLQNPLKAEVEIEDITILTQGNSFKATSHNIVLGPLCSQKFTLSGIAEEGGQLKIIGCRATVRGCHTEDFLILTHDWKPPYRMKQKVQNNSSVIKQAMDLPDPKELLLKVIDPLPLLSVSSTSLLQPSLMLLDGERSKVQFTLRNDSLIGIDFITVTFDDSLKQQLEEALGNKDLHPADTHEVQLQLIQKPAVKWLDQQPSLKIDAGASHTIEVEIMGKPGLTYVSLLVDYAFLGKPRTEVTETFYTRQLSYSIATTVNGGVDVPRCMIMPFQGGTISLKQDSMPNHEERVPSQDENPGSRRQENTCMLLLDVRNLWPHPLEVTFRVAKPMDGIQEDVSLEQTYMTSELLRPGQITRVVLLVPRIFIQDAEGMIPNLDTRRQFVVSASKLSIEAEAATREAFWYRERLLACLRADWKEDSGSRKGQVDLRKDLRLNARMIEALRIDPIDISFTLRSDPESRATVTKSESVKILGPSHYSLERNEFAVLVANVQNRGNHEVQLLLRLQPSLRNQPHNVALELSKRFVWSGSLQQALHPPVRAGEIRQVELGILVLAAGQYEVNGLVEEIRRNSSSDIAGPKDFVAGNERHIWHARQPCQIDVIGSTGS